MENKKYLDLEGLKSYDGKLKEYIDEHGGGGATPIIDTDNTTLTLEPNKYYRIGGTPTSLDITLGEPEDDSVINEYMFEFTAGDGFTMSVSPSVNWSGDVPSEKGKLYQVSILNGVALCASVSTFSAEIDSNTLILSGGEIDGNTLILPAGEIDGNTLIL